MTFAELRLAEPLLRAVAAEGYSTPTPIQVKAIPPLLSGGDLIGCAQTGTGKTAAFALPILHRLSTVPARHPGTIRTLVLAPTRELAAQIGESFRTYGRHTRLRHAVVFGGVGQDSQVRALRGGVEILVATPGRLLDLMEQGYVDLRFVEVFVLDEADRMLDLGFIHPIRQIAARLPQQRQTLLFSATMPPEIRRLATAMMTRPTEISVAPVSAAADTVEQSVYFVAKADKPMLLQRLLKSGRMHRTLVFTRTKHGADRVVKQLRAAGLPADAIHGNKSQNARERALDNFKSQRTAVLVATDIASRGIDIDSISHVVNYDVPNEPETYVHRIGRTGRAGATGVAFSFCDATERQWLTDIERLIRRRIPAMNGSTPAGDAAAEAGGARRVAADVRPPHHQPRPHRPPTARAESAAAVIVRAPVRPGRGMISRSKRLRHPMAGVGHRRF